MKNTTFKSILIHFGVETTKELNNSLHFRKFINNFCSFNNEDFICWNPEHNFTFPAIRLTTNKSFYIIHFKGMDYEVIVHGTIYRFNNDVCLNCGGDKGLHHYETMQCPLNGIEAPVNAKEQIWENTTFLG